MENVTDVPHAGIRFASARLAQTVERTREPTFTDDGAMSKPTVTREPERDTDEMPAADTPEAEASTPALDTELPCTAGVTAAAETAALVPSRANGAMTSRARSVSVRRREGGVTDVEEEFRSRLTR